MSHSGSPITIEYHGADGLENSPKIIEKIDEFSSALRDHFIQPIKTTPLHLFS